MDLSGTRDVENEMDDLIKGSINWVWGFAKEVLFDKLSYAVGWLVIKLFTLGRNPAHTLAEGLRDSEEESWVSLVGFLVVLGLGARLYWGSS